MELFHEMYGCYYNVVAQILAEAHGDGISKSEIDRIVAENAFSETGLHMMPKLLSGEWSLLQEEEGQYRSALQNADTALPLTTLQKAWLKAILNDSCIRLFLDEQKWEELRYKWSNIAPLYDQEDFHVFDQASDGDPYDDEDYIRKFRMVLKAIREQGALKAAYDNGMKRRTQILFFPQRMIYSEKDDKFRVAGRCLVDGKAKPLILNMGRIASLTAADAPPFHKQADRGKAQKKEKRVVTLALYKERNALERCMLHFASYNKQTWYNEERDCHICEIEYDTLEETELLIRILSFGPVVEVLGPESFLKQVRERVKTQSERLAFI